MIFSVSDYFLTGYSEFMNVADGAEIVALLSWDVEFGMMVFYSTSIPHWSFTDFNSF